MKKKKFIISKSVQGSYYNTIKPEEINFFGLNASPEMRRIAETMGFKRNPEACAFTGFTALRAFDRLLAGVLANDQENGWNSQEIFLGKVWNLSFKIKSKVENNFASKVRLSKKSLLERFKKITEFSVIEESENLLEIRGFLVENNSLPLVQDIYLNLELGENGWKSSDTYKLFNLKELKSVNFTCWKEVKI